MDLKATLLLGLICITIAAASAQSPAASPSQSPPTTTQPPPTNTQPPPANQPPPATQPPQATQPPPATQPPQASQPPQAAQPPPANQPPPATQPPTASPPTQTTSAPPPVVQDVADLSWATSSSSTFSAFRYVSDTWNSQQSTIVLNIPDSNLTIRHKVKDKDEIGKDQEKIGGAPQRILSATFADLPGPELHWEKMPTAPVPRLDGAAIQIKNLLFVFAGYGTINLVHSHVDVYNFTDNTWGESFPMPKEMAHSHLGMVTDGRYIYVVTGQYGPQCRGPTAHNFVLDTETKQWKDLPSLPFPRYAPATQLWRGRLHVMGGSGINRYTPEVNHWSLAVKDGKPLEKEWRSEVPIPRGGPHRACVVVDDKLIVIGGQEGDFMAKPGSPIFKCSRRHEVVFADVYMLDDEMKWKTLPPMPKPDSHIEFAWTIVNHSIIIAGGTTDKHPNTKKMILNAELFRFDLDTLKWSVIGKLPYRVKTTLVGFWDGWFYFTSGQRDKGPDDPSPKKVIGEIWRTKLRF